MTSDNLPGFFAPGEQPDHYHVHVSLKRDGYGAHIFEDPHGNVFLAWSDYILNEWTEQHGSLAHALLRLAVLEQCSADEWRTGFREQGGASTFSDWQARASVFLSASVTAF